MDLRNTEVDSINIRPSFGSSASFTAVNQSLTFGDNYSMVMPKGINSLKMKLNLNFNDLNDVESLDIITFLQKQFYYKTQDYNDLGHFNNKRVPAFSYSPFFPYKQNFFNCVTYNHEKIYYDVNSVTSLFESTSASTLSNTDNHLASYNLSSSDPASNTTISATITNTSTDLDIILRENSYLYAPNSYKTYKVLSSDLTVSPSESKTIQIENNSRFFESFNDGLTKQTSSRRSIFIKSPAKSSFYPYSPRISSGSLDFAMFDFRPNQNINLSYSPKFKKTSISDVYQKYNLYGFNPNLLNMQLNFSGRTNEEAKRILLFLESHLGYKKFCFHVQKDYLNNTSNSINTTPHRRKLSFFYCPEWSHTFTYYNSHDITATFIECSSF